MDGSMTVPEPVATRLDPQVTAVLVMDITDPLCTKRPRCVASVPAIAGLIERARGSGAPVIYTVGPMQPAVILDPVAPRDGEVVVRGRADKFHGTELDEALRQRGVTTLLLVGTAANGAVLYTAFAANLRGYTVAVAIDAISADLEATERFVAWQLLNQPGFTNADNTPLATQRVTLTHTDLVTFGDAA
jgi:nicotinamidase-related amidase